MQHAYPKEEMKFPICSNCALSRSVQRPYHVSGDEGSGKKGKRTAANSLLREILKTKKEKREYRHGYKRQLEDPFHDPAKKLSIPLLSNAKMREKNYET